LPILCKSCVEQPRDVGMIQGREDFLLAGKSLLEIFPQAGYQR
jgi:hypothetical protein